MNSAAKMQDRAAELCDSRHCEEAIGLLEEILERFPGDPDVHNLLGICYSGGCEGHLMVQPDIALEHFRSAQECDTGGPARLNRARVLSGKGSAYSGARRLSRPAALRAAIECHEAAAAIYLEQGRSKAWARQQYLLGNAWCEIPPEECPDKWERAIASYHSALQVRTRDTDPFSWAAVQQNMGTAYRELPCGDRASNMGRAIGCYRLALRIYTREEFPGRYAALHNNIGNVYLSLPAADQDGTRRRVRLALRHFDVALAIRTRDAAPGDRAVTQFNRGNAFLRLAELEPVRAASLRQAEKCFRDAEVCCSLSGDTDNAIPVDLSLPRAEEDRELES
jgi:tetratricopeptide (TPR) repeat protein